MKNIFPLAFLVILALGIVGCNKGSQHHSHPKDKVLADQQNWVSNYNKQDKANRNVALSKAPNREQAVKMETAADEATYEKLVSMSHQPNFSNIPESERITQTRAILEEAEKAKEKMRDSSYNQPFQPNW